MYNNQKLKIMTIVEARVPCGPPRVTQALLILHWDMNNIKYVQPSASSVLTHIMENPKTPTLQNDVHIEML
jgi:hypothetical protein